MSKNGFKKPELPTSNGESVRLNKYLSEAGLCSRREADRLIEEGKVQIDGKTAVMGERVAPGQKVTVNGKSAVKEEKQILIAFNKPRGIVCTTDKREPDNIIDYLSFNKRIYPIGRLDKESEGLILLTNNGEIVNKILRGSNNHEKEYIVKVDKPITRAFLKGMTSGVPILDTVTKPCEIRTLDRYTFHIIITQGLNRQIRRMCEYFDYKVLELKRIRIMNIKLARLNEGGYRNITEQEYEELIELISESNNDPAYYEDENEGIIHDDYQMRLKEEKKKKDIQKKEAIEKKTLTKKEKEQRDTREVRGYKDSRYKDKQYKESQYKDNQYSKNNNDRNESKKNDIYSNKSNRAEGDSRDGYRKESYSKEGYKTERNNRDSYRREGYKAEGNNREGYQRESYKAEGNRREGYRKVGNKSEGNNKEGYRKENYKTESSYGDSNRKESYNKENYRRDNSSKVNKNTNNYKSYSNKNSGLKYRDSEDNRREDNISESRYRQDRYREDRLREENNKNDRFIKKTDKKYPLDKNENKKQENRKEIIHGRQVKTNKRKGR